MRVDRRSGLVAFMAIQGACAHPPPASAPTAPPPLATTPPPAPASAPPKAAAPDISIFGSDTALPDNVLGGLVNPDGTAVPAGSSALPPGSLDKEIIRRVIRRHINEVKYCYESQLTTIPDLLGRITVRFTISATGDVIASVLESSTMRNAAVESCTVQAVGRWQSPKPLGGGIVIVSYPFVLAPVSIPILAGKRGAGALDVVPLNDHLFVHRSTDGHAVTANGMIARTDNGLLLFDTAWTEVQTAALLAWGDRRLGGTWLAAVITHDHSDRDGGIAVLFRRRIPVEALDLTVAKLTGRGVKGVGILFEAHAGELTDRRGFEAFYPGPGHAADNIVIAFPSLQTLFGGCLVKAADATTLGFTGDADRAGWSGAVQRVAAKYPYQTIVPGHGPVDHEGAAYGHTIDLLRAPGR
jgi:metallo-beta-lactamase class B